VLIAAVVLNVELNVDIALMADVVLNTDDSIFLTTSYPYPYPR